MQTSCIEAWKLDGYKQTAWMHANFMVIMQAARMHGNCMDAWKLHGWMQTACMHQTAKIMQMSLLICRRTLLSVSAIGWIWFMLTNTLAYIDREGIKAQKIIRLVLRVCTRHI
jgi:hypothetical protein